MNNKLRIGLLTATLLITTNSFGVGMTSGEYVIAKKATDAAQWAVEKAEAAAQWGVESGFHETLTELSLENQVLSTQAGFNGNRAYDAAMNKAGELGGAYGKDLVNVMNSCFDFELPSFSKSLGMDGMSFCGIGDMSDLVDKAIKGKTDTIQTKNEDKVNKKQDVPIGTKINSSKRGSGGSKKNCNSSLDKSCGSKSKAAVKREIENGVGAGGESSTIAVKMLAKDIYYQTKEETDEDKLKDLICTNSELVDGTTQGYVCRKDIVEDTGTYSETDQGLLNSTSPLLDSSEREVRVNMINTNEKFSEAITKRINLSRDIRDDYNIKYNPNTLAIKDVEKMGEDSFYKRNKDMLNQDPTLYIVPKLDNKDNKFSFVKYGLDNYKDAFKEFSNLEIEDTDGNILESKEQVKKNIERLGGVTPFTSALYGYDSSLAVISKNIYDGSGSEKSGEQGSIGREFALVNGLKGLMYQSVLLNQQLENMNRVNYNIRIKEFDKLSSDNDNLNNKLEQIQNQNTMIINILERIDSNLNKIANK